LLLLLKISWSRVNARLSRTKQPRVITKLTKFNQAFVVRIWFFSSCRGRPFTC